jgi:hypothetical protein
MLSSCIFSDLAKLETARKGSEPEDKINRSGVVAYESGNILCKSKGNDSTNYGPIVFLTN